MEPNDAVKLPKEVINTPKLPARVLDIARLLRDVIPAVKWYIHVMIADEYASAILGAFRDELAANEAFKELAMASGGISTHQSTGKIYPVWYIEYTRKDVLVVVTTIEDVKKIDVFDVNEWLTRNKGFTTKPFEEFKQAVLAPPKKKPTA